MDNRVRILGILLLATFAVLDSLVAQGVITGEIAALIHDVALVALPALGLGGLADVLTIERRRRDPSIPAICDDIRDVTDEAAS